MQHVLPSTPAAPPRQVTCLVIAKNRLYRELLVGWISCLEGALLAVRGESPASAETLWSGWLPDVLLLEVGSSTQQRFSLAKTFLTLQPEGRVIVLTDRRARFRPPDWLAERIGAVLCQTASLPELSIALEITLRNIHQSARSFGVRRIQGRRLSLREMEVLRLIGDGLSSSAIARHLNISLHTVATHRKRIAAKLGTQGNQLSRLAVLLREPRVVQP